MARMVCDIQAARGPWSERDERSMRLLSYTTVALGIITLVAGLFLLLAARNIIPTGLKLSPMVGGLAMVGSFALFATSYVIEANFRKR